MLQDFTLPGHLWSLSLKEAFMWHDGQIRKQSGLPYITHCIEVAFVLNQLGFTETTVIAGLLHDTLEDTKMPPDRVEKLFGRDVLDAVKSLSEVKLDESGNKLPWIVRKTEHISRLKNRKPEVRAIALADQWHNLKSTSTDWAFSDTQFWNSFNSSAPDYLMHHKIKAMACYQNEPELKILYDCALKIVQELEIRVSVEIPDAQLRFSEMDWAC